MKIRIKGNSVRLRLTRSDVAALHLNGRIEEETMFGSHKFIYALQSTDSTKMSAEFIAGKITVFIPASQLINWHINEIVGFNNSDCLTETDSLYLLVEKDFACLDESAADTADQYENPNQHCS